jgi:hypothetical protein
MEIMNYNQMLENANAVKILVNKTIECSKDYTDIKSDDVLEQIAEYIANTISDILHDPICSDSTFRNYASGGGLSFARYGGDGEGAQAQFFFSTEGTHLRLYFNAIGHWWADKKVSDNGLKALIRLWPEIKQQINAALKRGIDRHNERLSTQLSRQLELHDAIKNFQV